VYQVTQFDGNIMSDAFSMIRLTRGKGFGISNEKNYEKSGGNKNKCEIKVEKI
jgi:hypothetical protein